MKSEIQIRNNADECHIDIEGTIGVPEEWQFEEPSERVATYDKFRDTLRRIGQIEARRITVDIRSTGGDVNDALLIHDALRSLGAHITTRCYGYTASAATIIAQAASEGAREISANALYLIHNSACTWEGNAAELAQKVDLLQQTDARIAGVYAARSQRPAEEFSSLMAQNNGNGRWLSPQEAIEAGLADTLIDTAEQPAQAPTNSLARNWERLLSKLGMHSRPQTPGAMPEGRNVVRTPQEEELLRRRSLAAMQEWQERAAPTVTKPCEDPSCRETLRSANQQAYAEDVKRIRK